MKIESIAFENNAPIPSKYTCDGESINPLLKISDVPDGTKSLALIMDDPDAPSGTFVHWVLWNINPQTKEISENSKPPEAMEGVTSRGKPGYVGPCPPSGTHRYFFKLYCWAQHRSVGRFDAGSSSHILPSGLPASELGEGKDLLCMTYT